MSHFEKLQFCNISFLFSFFLFFEQTSQFDAFTNADDLSQIGTVYSTKEMNNTANAELNVRALPTIVWSEMKDTDKWQCYDHFQPFFGTCIFIFHKTQVQMVILRCFTCLDIDHFKNYDTKCKFIHFWFFVIMYKIKH